ncbi:two-component sensor histidine kinase [Marinicauda pacifica]|uniref:histidine kinase n=1 Tax=Marinicauda pacifica TaxID=1133559 RepID=A0A4S2HB11_9PROT|nr:PAS domain-containing sensor histidine kinase [Marinicauda pacifica]TGY93117.1 PAS domain-containing sensor histidine kinase [Marinicauda pacifica]GGE42991.1 two-component sensor histidine kinase [Marinicauda pacifica]
MAVAEPVQLATFIVTVGSVAFGVAAALWAFRLTAGVRRAQAQWRRRVGWLEDRLSDSDSIFSAHPGLVIVWDSPPDVDAGNWAKPKVYGSPTALAAMLKFADLGGTPGEDETVAAALLDGFADFEARSASGEDTTLRQRMRTLMESGQPFSLTVAGPSGRFIEADGRAAGAQLVLWLSDATIRGLEESGARGRLEEARRTVSEDPLAFLDMLGRAPYPAFRMNASGKLEWVNPAYVRAVGAKDAADVLSSQIFLDVSIREQGREVLASGQARRSIKAAVVESERRVLELALYPVSGGIAGLALDITEGEGAKDELERLAEAHDQTLDHMAEAVAIFDRSRKLSFYNRAFARLFRLDEAMLNERPGHGALLDRLREKRLLPEQADYTAWREAELSQYENPPADETPDELWSLPDGRTLRVARQRHPHGGLLFIFEDMTDQLTLQARYTTLMKVQRATLDRLNEAVAVFGSDGKLKLSNAAFAKVWNLDAEALENAPFEQVADACHALFPDPDRWNELKARITDPGPDARKATTGEIRRSDGTVLTWLTRPLPDGATLIAWDDITDSRRIEAALRDKAEALEASERIKTEFVKHVSYQLRTPLTTIGGYADLLAAGLAGELNDGQKDHMSAIQSASGQLAKLIDDILDIAAIDAGQLELELGDVRLDEMAEEACNLLASRAEHESVRLNLAFAEEGAAIRADSNRIKQVLYNLITNAMDHVDAGGEVEIGARIEGNDACLWVNDDGRGIAPERQAKIFERFESGEGGGAGLGLALVNDIVRLHGGWVELESEPGKGTTVMCHLPTTASGDHSAPELELKGSRGA